MSAHRWLAYGTDVTASVSAPPAQGVNDAVRSSMRPIIASAALIVPESATTASANSEYGPMDVIIDGSSSRATFTLYCLKGTLLE